MDRGLDYLQRIHSAVIRAAEAKGSDDPMEVCRQTVRELGLPETMLWRQPFPGPGLAVRMPGPVTRERLEVLRRADAIVVEEMKASGWYTKVWQSFAVLLPVRSVGVMGDERTY